MLLGFKKQFVQPILVGTKILTLRKPRKVKPKIGETLYMYTALRTKHCQHITSAHTLKSVQQVSISILADDENECYKIICIIDGKTMTYAKVKKLAVLDGFKNVTEWMHYWLDGKDSVSELLEMYHWTHLKF